MKTEKEIIDKINEYFKLSDELKSNLRNIGFVDALRWVVEDNEDK